MTVLNVNEAAGYLRVTPGTIRRWVAAGLLPAVRVGPRIVRIKFTDLLAFLEQYPVR